MNWFRSNPSPELKAVNVAEEQLELERKRKNRSLQELLRALGEIPVDDGLVKIGEDLTQTPEGGA